MLQRGYQDLSQEFASREPGAPSYTWFEPDPTVGFWIRRMAQEGERVELSGWWAP